MQGRRLLNGDTHALEEMRQQLAERAEQKRTLLIRHGYPEDYLDPIYTCRTCKDTGYLEDHSRCDCLKRKIVRLLYEQSGLESQLSTENFDRLSTEYYEGEDLVRFEKAVQSAKKFVTDFNSHYHNLFFYGTVGTGKSFLSCCIARELLDAGKSVKYFSAGALFDKISDLTFRSKEKETRSYFYQELYDCDLLIIDDLGTELVNAFVASELFDCLNERHLREKATIISSNISLEELRDHYSERIFSRITSHFELLKFTGPDIRMHKKRIANRK
jgi:DNA replication protein DnaC